MSQSAREPNEESLVQPSKFGRRFGIGVAIVLLVLALLAGVGTLTVGDSSKSASEPASSTSRF